ncbi:helix-turn-helix domain-containing protein [Paenibacillus sp. UNC499MF]|uniref:helix-turn-helix domain-containing protein n=1 Tax=Paenibacillus sp. UNC499MF TaxID=1502751 RepID=UPI0008A02E53|nr:helix-turn-helix domain-containing protein [Paenibacillus sp. UNC499MF]SEG67017.1 Helix-turn-helix domain-containing protein [Paenibacillus sp. UNC499MF]
MKKIRFNRRSVIVTWLISYLTVLLVPVLINGIIYMVTWNVVETEVNRSNEAVIRQMEQAIDNHLKGIERLSVEMALNKRLAGFIHAGSPLTDNDHYELIGIAGDLGVYKVANDFIDQIYVYYKNSDTVISSRERTDSRALYEILRENESTGYGEWKSFFDKRFIQEYAPVTLMENGGTASAVLYAKSIILDNPDLPGGVILFVIKDSKLLANLSSVNHASVAVLDQKNRLLASSGPGSKTEFPAYGELSGKSGLIYKESSGGKMAVSYTTSGQTGWKYVSMMPADIYNEKMKHMSILIFVNLFLSLLVGGILTFLFLKKNYSPIHVLIRNLSVQSGVAFDEGSNEYGFVQNALNNAFAEKEIVSRRLMQHRDAIRSHFLQGLLKGRLDPNVPVHESLAAHDIGFQYENYAVLLFRIDQFGKWDESGGNDAKKIRQIHFLLMNVAEEAAAAGNCRAVTTGIDDVQACILNIGPEAGTEEIRRLAGQVRTFLEDHFQVRLTIAISGVHPGLAGIPLAYQEALGAMEYRIVMGSGEMIAYGDLPGGDESGEAAFYSYPMHVEQQLINFVKAGDFVQANALVEGVIELNVVRKTLSVPLSRCLLFDLVGTLLKALDEIGLPGKRELIRELNPAERLAGSETLKEMTAGMREVLERVCGFIQESRKPEHDQLSRQVMEYVRHNYSSENLNITMIGEAFGLTPSYLSKQFKAQTGEALLDVIQKIRLAEAKKLLSQSSDPIIEIARKVGYSDINTFNRIFKKFEGVTPGKYKEIL